MAITNKRVEFPGRDVSVVEANEQTLRGIELFAALNKQELAVIEQNCRWRIFASHQQIIDRESPARDVFFVVRGKVRIVNYSFSGRGITLDELHEGSYFGELSAIDSQPRSARVVSLSESLIASMPQKFFLETLETHPKLALLVMAHLSQLLRGANQRIMDLSTLGANNRVHADLVRQVGELGIETGSAILDPVPVHNDIASRVSTTRETVARVMNDLARRGIVEKKGNALHIKDVKRLRDMVEDVRGE
ncbi:MAG: Crp/Fnr family transcriptional regulator [Rhodospirillales bacterium]|nr:Crp/Fnr family transcriptional regulator [Rhodospirillales bacterium]